MDKYNTSAVEARWSNEDSSSSDKNFYSFEPIRSRSCELIFGEKDASDPEWCEKWTVGKFLRHKIPFEKCLSICCGFGPVERILNRLGVAREYVGTDIAAGAIESAIAKANEEGLANLSYFVADLNTYDLPENEYDLIWANGALHHIKELDVVIPKLFRALKSGGILISVEFVGPNYQQLSIRHQEIINSVKHLLPDDLRGKRFYANNGSIFSKVVGKIDKIRDKNLYSTEDNYFGKVWQMPSREWFLKEDPSECVNSDNIIGTLSKYFKDMDVRYFDGSISFYALDSNFYNNYDKRNKNHRDFLNLLFNMEDYYIASGEIGRHNAHIICCK